MASMRVHELAKEFGMSSKELLDRLQQMKIPAKNHASTLVDAYVDKIRKELGPELAERAAAIQAEAEKEEAARRAAEEAARIEEEAARKAAEEAELARREQERIVREREIAAGELPTGFAGIHREEKPQQAPAAKAAPVQAAPAPVAAAPVAPVQTAPVSVAPVKSTAAPVAAAKPAPAQAAPVQEAPAQVAAAPAASTQAPAVKAAVQKPEAAPVPDVKPAAASEAAQQAKKAAQAAPVQPKAAAPAATPAHAHDAAAAPAKAPSDAAHHVQPSAEKHPAKGPKAPAAPAQGGMPAKVPAPAAAPAPAPVKSAHQRQFDSLLSQINAEKARIEKERERAAAAAKEAKAAAKAAKAKPQVQAQPAPARGAASQAAKTEDAEGKDARGAHNAHKKVRATEPGFTEPEDEGEDRYKRMAHEAEKFQRSRVLDEARAAVEQAERDAEGEGRRKKRKQKRVAEKEAEEKAEIQQAIASGIAPIDSAQVKIPTGSTVAEFAELVDVPANDVIKRLFMLGSPLTLTQTISDDLIELIADDLGRDVRVTTPEEQEELVFYDPPESLVTRPPVVTVMGHVDHGKTSLLDAIRETGVVATEAGGITQHIGASVVHINGRQITFIDTPGHEAFTAMRARGAKITDVVVLVVAADDGVMPQTVEAIHHAEAAGVPIVVAVNKIDKPGANPDRVRQELTEHNIVPEEWGGSNMFVNVSAKKRIGIDDLLETILLQADVLELKANPDALASGFVIEAKLDKGRGPVGTVLVHRGTLHVGDMLVAGTAYGRVRAMLDPKGNNVDEAKPADPVEVLGLSSLPDAGDEFRVFEDERDARKLAEDRAFRRRIAEQQKPHMSLDDLFNRIDQGTTELNLVVKADVQGSIEALEDALAKMDQSEVKINVIHAAVGGITETDVTLAAASDAIIIGFNVRPQAKAKAAAEKEKVDIRTYRVIYEAIDEINAARVGLLKPEIVERDTASLEVRSLFRVPKVGVIAGCYVTEGEISRDDKVRIVRDGTVVHEGTIGSLHRFKDDVKTVKSGYECGVGIDGYQDVHEGDIIEAYRIEEIARES